MQPAGLGEARGLKQAKEIREMLTSSKWVRTGWLAPVSALTALLALAGAGVAAAQSSGEPLDERESYAFVRTLVGQATVASDGQGIGNTLERNQPLLSGDRLRTGNGSRIEVLLPDRNRLTVDRDTVLNLNRLAFSGDRDSRITVLALDEGEMLLEVSAEALGDELPQIETGRSTIYVQEPGLYRVRYDRDGYLELLVREGYAEMVTDQGSTIVRAGESAEANGDSWGRVQVAAAGPTDALERWSDDLLRTAERAGRSRRYLDGNFSYANSDFDGYGDWVSYSNVNYWRPRVAVGWSPYWDGRWAWTPSGYTWVSYEPWGWVPYHYGRWCQVPGYGWAWRPGYVYSPAWVYWHWSGGYAGWCPIGYYTDYYNPWYRGGFRFGFYGWAGGSWGMYSHWNFAPVHCFRDRNFHGQFRRGDDLHREKGWPEMPRGLITTDTRDFRPDRIDRADQLIHKIGIEQKNRLTHELPDVSDFVGRRRDLTPPVAKAISPDGPRDAKLKFDEPKVATAPAWRQRDNGDKTNVVRIDTGQTEKGRERSPQAGGSIAGKRDDRSDLNMGAGQTSKDRERGPQSGSAVAGKGEERGSQGWRGSAPADAIGKRGSAPAGGKSDEPRVAKAPAPRSVSSDPARGRSTGIASDNRQGWKEQGSSGSKGSTYGTDRRPVPADRSNGSSTREERPRSSAPVERVISGTRRPAPQAVEGGKGGSDAYRSVRSTPPSSGSSSAPKRTLEPGYESRNNAAPKATPRYDGGSRQYESPRYGSGSGSAAKRETPGQSSPRYGGSSSDSARSYRAPAPSRPAYSAPQAQRSTNVTRAPAGGSSSSARSSQPATGSRSSAGSQKSSGSGGKSSSSSSGSKSASGGSKKDR
jgi:hypothetical protein